MPGSSQPPHLLSWTFHSRFFPSLLYRRVFPKEKTVQSPFAGHAKMELSILLAVSLVASITGYAEALRKGSILGWIFALAGTGGVLFLFVHGIRSQAGIKPSFDDFRVGVFFFLVFLGFTAGLGTGHAYKTAYGVRLLCGLVGALAGYILGIFGGLWIQRLGWLSEVLNFLAGVALIGMVIVDIILLL
jgi:hypothetical protein